MSTSQFLHRQADVCLRIARHCFDLASAEHIRLLASDLKSKAHEFERQEAVDRARMDWTVPSSQRDHC